MAGPHSIRQTSAEGSLEDRAFPPLMPRIAQPELEVCPVIALGRHAGRQLVQLKQGHRALPKAGAHGQLQRGADLAPRQRLLLMGQECPPAVCQRS